jgi:hypothetical protein
VRLEIAISCIKTNCKFVLICTRFLMIGRTFSEITEGEMCQVSRWFEVSGLQSVWHFHCYTIVSRNIRPV